MWYPGMIGMAISGLRSSYHTCTQTHLLLVTTPSLAPCILKGFLKSPTGLLGVILLKMY